MVDRPLTSSRIQAPVHSIVGLGPYSITVGPGTMVTVVLAASVFAAAACGGDSQGVVRGVIIDVQSTSLTTLESLTLRDDSGKVWTFSAQGPLAGC